jgi:hypothetical protein
MPPTVDPRSNSSDSLRDLWPKSASSAATNASSWAEDGLLQLVEVALPLLQGRWPIAQKGGALAGERGG